MLAKRSLDNLAPEVRLAQRFVSIDTTSRTSGQEAGFTLAADLLRGAGYRVDIDIDPDGAGYPRFLLATPPPLPGVPLLLFACHLDTVPVGDAASWAQPPHSATIHAGRLHGRGASDMKAGLGATLTVLVDHPRHAAALLLTADEEVGCLGASAALPTMRQVDVGAVVVPEPTDNQVLLGHRGALWLRLDATGTAAHASTPELGRNALLALASAVLSIDAELPRAKDPLLGATTVNVATMTAGTAVNIVPDHAQARLDIRYVDPDEARTIPAWFGEAHPDLDITVERDIPPVRTAATGDWVDTLPSPVEHASAAYFTDAAVLGRLFPAAPVVIWGPGHPRQAHVRDEYATASDITHAAALYRHTVLAWQHAHGGRDVKEVTA